MEAPGATEAKLARSALTEKVDSIVRDHQGLGADRLAKKSETYNEVYNKVGIAPERRTLGLYGAADAGWRLQPQGNSDPRAHGHKPMNRAAAGAAHARDGVGIAARSNH